LLTVVVNGLPGVGKTTLARPLSRLLGLPLLSKDVVKESLGNALGCPDPQASKRLGAAASDVLWSILADAPAGAVLEGWFAPYADDLRRGLALAGARPVLEVWCACPVEEARRRYTDRTGHRHPVHFDAGRLDAWDEWAAKALPVGIGPVLQVDTTTPVDALAVAAWVRDTSVNWS
jgi:predicted kinase